MDTSTASEECVVGDTKWNSTVTEIEAQERIDLGVSPSDEKWNDAYRMFEDLFADEDTPIGEILTSKFTQHEISLFMLSTSEILKAIQDDNTDRFNALLQTRLQDAAPEIITKLTMLYFGLPIEPIDFSLTDMTYKMEIREPDSPQSAGDRPLQFLTEHKQRNWGDERLLGKEDQSHSIPTQLPPKLLSGLYADFFSYAPMQKGTIGQQNESSVLRLRGGEADENSDWEMPGDNSDWEEDDGDLSYAASSSEDGSEDGDAKEGRAKKNQSRQRNKESNEAGSHTASHDEASPDKKSDDKASDNGASDDETGDAECEEDSAHVLPDSNRDNFVTLYGYQGSVAFIAGDQPTYEEAIRRLLSLGPQDNTTFHICHFAKSCSLVDNIADTFPLRSNSTSLEYISKQDLTLQPSFFIKLGDEDVPEHWEPSEAQMTCEISKVTWKHHAEKALGPTSESTGPVSCCYLEFPTPDFLLTARGNVNSWNFDHYNAYVRAAFEVVLGPPLGSFHHAFFHMYHPSIDYSTSPEYGFPAIKNYDIKKVSSFLGKDTLELRCTRLDERNEIAFFLPSYHNNDCRLGRISRSEENISEALELIRQIISSAFGEETKRLRYVSLLQGCETLGPETNRNQKSYKSYSIQLKDDGAENFETTNVSVLSEFFDDASTFALLYPEWEEDITTLSISNPNGYGEASSYVQIPPLSSTVDDFRIRVFELMRLTGYEPSQTIGVRSGKSFISIQPLPEDGYVSSQYNAPCFFIGFNTTDEEWFKIRARISTPKATVRIIDSEKWNWNWGAGGQKTSVWGPRYGRMAEAYAMKKQPKKVTWAEEAEVIQDSVTSESSELDCARTSAKDEEPGAVSRLDWAQLRSRNGKAASDSEKQQKAYATQPSVFDRHGLVPWPAQSGIQIPTSAPPFETMLRTGPRMPLVSKAILTPTEQGELQRVAWDLRNLCLNRAVRCPYDGCNFSYTLNDENAMGKHLKACHTARKCLWCDETLYEHWDTARIDRHIRENHRDELMQALGVSQAAIRRFDQSGAISIPLRRVNKHPGRSTLALASEYVVCGPTKFTEPQRDILWGFCDHCGREENYINASERIYHRKHCAPGIFNGANCTFCNVCGKSIWSNAAEAHKSGKSDGQLSHCSHNLDDTNGFHCSRCGYNMSRLPQVVRDHHQKRCKGFSALSGRFCIYCGEEFRNTETQLDWNRNKAHMVACYSRNPEAVWLGGPEEAALKQQQNNLRLQIKTAALASEGEQEQNGKDGDLNGDINEQPSQTESVRDSTATTDAQMKADSSAENAHTALQEIVDETTAISDISRPPISSMDSERHGQETLRTILRQSIPDTPHDEPSPGPTTEVPDNTPQQKSLNPNPTRQASPVLPAEETEKEPEFEPRPESPLFVSSSSSEAESDNGSVFGEDNEVDERHSANGESEDELLSDPSKSKRRKPRGRKRTRDGDNDYQDEGDEDDDSEIDEDELSSDPSKSKRRKTRGRKRTRDGDHDYQAESDDGDDDDSEIDVDEEGRRSKPPRRLPSPDWRKKLGDDDPSFVPSEEYYCSKCFRKAPKKHKRDRSPLGRIKEIELHHDSSRCCGIRRGIGSIERLPNRSGWIPANLMPKPLATLRRKFLRRYPVYARTIYPLNATNANGTYWRSDPNNESNSAWWSAPWPPFRGPSPLPNGWEAPDVVDVPAAGRGRQQFQLKPVLDPTYRQGGDVQDSDDEDVDDVESDKDDNGKRKRKRKAIAAKKNQKTAANVEPTNVEPTNVEPTNVEPTNVEPTNVEPTNVEPTNVEPTDAEPTGVEKAATPRPLKKRALDPTYRQDNDVQYSDEENEGDAESDQDAGRKRKRKRRLFTAPDPTYRQGNDVQYSDDEIVDNVQSDKDINGKRKRKGKATTAKKRQKTTVNDETADVPRPVKAKPQAALLNTDAQQLQEGEAVTRRSTRKRQKTVKA